MQIDRCRTDMEIEDQNARKETQAIDPLLHGISEAQEIMADFQATLVDNDDVNVDGMIENLNEDQLRIFDTVRNYVHMQCMSSQTENAQPFGYFHQWGYWEGLSD